MTPPRRRQAVEPNRKRGIQIPFRATAEERALIDAAAEECDLDRQTYVLQTMLWAAGKRSTRPMP